MPLLVFEAADEIVIVDLFAADRTPAHVIDPAFVVLMQEVEAQIVRANRRVEFDGDRNEPEVDSSGPNRVCCHRLLP